MWGVARTRCSPRTWSSRPAPPAIPGSRRSRESSTAHRPAPFQGVPQPSSDPGRGSAGGWRWELRRGDRDRARAASPDVVIGPGHGAGANRGGRESSRSNAHTPHVVHGDSGVDGEQFHRQKGSRPVSRPASRDPSGSRATQGLCRGGHRATAANDGGEERISCPRGWKGHGSGERRLVYWIHTQP